MTVNDVVELVQGNSGIMCIILIIIASLVEIAPVKINPWSWIGRVLNKDVMQKVEKIEKDVADVKKEVGENTAVSSRYRILRFDDELLHGIKHTKEHFDQILLDIDVYEKYCDSHPQFRNNLAVLAIDHIKTVYQKCSQDNLFL